MVESKKKTTQKKSTTGSKKTPAKSTSEKTKKPAPKKTTATTKSAPPVVKKVSQKTSKTKKYKTITPSHFSKDIIPETAVAKVSKPARMDMSIFTTILALFIVALVVLGGFIYSRQSRMMEPPAPPRIPSSMEPQRISISSAVILTPEIITALENLVTKIAIGPDEVLQKVRSINDAQTETAFPLDAQSGDLVFEFKSASILYRPSTKEIIKTATNPVQ